MRDNVFDVYVSSLRARQSGVWHPTPKLSQTQRDKHAKPLIVNVQDAFAHMSRNYAYYAWLQATFGGDGAITVKFDDLRRNFNSEMNRGLGFLGADPMEYPDRFEALNRTPHAEGIENWAEVQSFFRRSIFSDLF
ncbi:hypothetical protein GCM10009069_04990 [Algimonas arctica]|uniref:Uncharacterized protein n=1 Tax=Algimonas arctica TaxID=1479486 RepID=A0A8J3CLP5_9PROT|nr:hypothetical protein GCM10009069_04990 [Algimonas arctica]